MHPIILASDSPRRKQLLTWAEVPFTVRPSGAEESYPENLLPSDVAIHIARNKAIAVQAEAQQGDIILAADTIVVLGNEIIGKPENAATAIVTLKKLSGQTHIVITGVAILKEKKEIVFADETAVTFHTLSDEEIKFYVEKYGPYDKAGAYAIQEWIGVVGIKKVEGDFYNVMGLPVSRVVQALKKLG